MAGSSTYHGVGRRKSAIARVWLKTGKGTLVINGRKYEDYFDTNIARNNIVIPFHTVGMVGKYDANINVQGGGYTSQSDAVRLGISRALLKYDEKLRPTLKKAKLLHCDARVKERKKYGQKGARAKFQFVKR